MATAGGTKETRGHVRRERERDIVDAARALFDARGLQDVTMDEVAKAVGINRAQIYRHFESKEEVFVLTVVRYLDEITAASRERVDPASSPVEQLRAAWGSFAGYCVAYPAFLDCALSLMRRPGRELKSRMSEATWFRLGQSMSECLAVTVEILEAGMREGEFAPSDAAFTTNCLYTQTLGIMHMARLGLGVTRAAPGVPQVFPVSNAQIQEACVRNTLAAVGIVPA